MVLVERMNVYMNAYMNACMNACMNSYICVINFTSKEIKSCHKCVWQDRCMRIEYAHAKHMHVS